MSHRDGAEVVRLILQIQSLTLEVRELRGKEQELERLRWRLAAVARRATA